MIPKIIHYCWFGKGAKPAAAMNCIESWKQYLPDYDIIEWNESNFDIDSNPYTRMCYDEKKYAFLSDYVRLLVVEKYGGIYFDTDVQVIKSFDTLLCLPAFFGFENDGNIATGLGFGAEPNNPVVHQMICEYDDLLDGKSGVVMCPKLNTDAALKFGLVLNGKKQSHPFMSVFPSDYFNPMNSLTGEINLTANTFSIHRYSMSWLPKQRRIRSLITRCFHRVFGEDCFKWIKRK